MQKERRIAKIVIVTAATALAVLALSLLSSKFDVLSSLTALASPPAGCTAGNCSGYVGTTATSTIFVSATSTSNFAITASGTIFSTSGGFKFPDNSIQITAYTGSNGLASSSAPNVSSGQFGANTGGGNYSFPSYLSVGTTTATTYLYLNGSNVNNRGQLSINAPDYAQISFYGSSTFGGQAYYDVPGNIMSFGGINTGSQVSLKTGVGSERLRIDSSGNVGIGTSTPIGIFHVTKNLAFTNGNDAQGIFGGTGGSPKTTLIGYDTTNDFGFIQAAQYGVSWNQNLILQGKGGNVGIGTTTPAYKLHVSGGRGVFEAASENFALGLRYSGSNGNTQFWLGASNSSSPDLLLSNVNGTEIARFQHGGNVGIGTSTPAQKLTVTGQVYSTTGGFRFPDGTVQTSAAAAGTSTTISATNVSSGAFGANTGSGNYSFPANLGIGTASLASWSAMAAIEGVNTAIGFGNSTDFHLLSNAYNDSGGWKYKTTNPAANFYLYNGTANWRVAGSGSANASISWTTAMTLDNSGRLGIGTASPAALLSVGTSTSGLVAQFGGGSGKIDVGTIDPVYTIGGKRYATYLPGMTGQKEETTGNASCDVRPSSVEGCEYTIDFRNLAQGSDLWLFGKATNIAKHFADMSVLLTPEFDGRTWYEKDATNLKLIVHAIPSEGRSANLATDALTFSYRLTAPRFDSAEWLNTSKASYEGFNLDKLGVN